MLCILIILALNTIITCEAGGLCHTLEGKLCRYSTYPNLFPEEEFRLWSGYGCYEKSNPTWLAEGKHLKPEQINWSNCVIAGVKIDERRVVFDVQNKDMLEEIESLYALPKYFEKWKICAQDAVRCCQQEMTNDGVLITEEYPCPSYWDKISCFPRGRVNDTAVVPCSPFTSSDELVCKLTTKTPCLQTGWNKTHYKSCASGPVYRRRHVYHVIVLSVASGLMLPAIILYFSFQGLRSLKTIIFHRNLVLAIFLKNVFVVVSKQVVILDALDLSDGNNIMSDSGPACKVLAFFECVSKNAVFTFMLADAFFLHKLLVRSFSREWNMIFVYIVTTILSLLPSVIWGVIMYINGKEECWMADNSGTQWINDGYKYSALSINVVLLLDIARVLFLKLGKNTNKKQTKAALKATIILLPLFGVPLLITSQRSMADMNNCLSADIYLYTTYTIEAAQGVLMAILFCYCSSEVQKDIKQFYRKRIKNNMADPSNVPLTSRRLTTTTVA